MPDLSQHPPRRLSDERVAVVAGIARLLDHDAKPLKGLVRRRVHPPPDRSQSIVDVVLQNFVYLGHMTQEEFVKPPAGMKVQERKDPELAVVSDEPVPDLDEVARAAAQNDAQ